jgi:hypothetical protein
VGKSGRISTLGTSDYLNPSTTCKMRAESDSFLFSSRQSFEYNLYYIRTLDSHVYVKPNHFFTRSNPLTDLLAAS